MTSLHVSFGLGPPIKNPGYAYAHGAFRALHLQITAYAPQARVNFCTSTRGPPNFCPKTGHHKRFSMKQQKRSSERDQAA